MIPKNEVGCTHPWETSGGEPCACPECVEAAYTRLADRLPRTEDGVPIVIGQTALFAIDRYGTPPTIYRIGIAFALTVGVECTKPRVMAGGSAWRLCSETYSTREAAEKARRP